MGILNKIIELLPGHQSDLDPNQVEGFVAPDLCSFQWVVGTRKGIFLKFWFDHLENKGHQFVIVNVKGRDFVDLNNVDHRSCSIRTDGKGHAKKLVRNLIEELKEGKHDDKVVVLYPLDRDIFRSEIEQIQSLNCKSNLIVAVNDDYVKGDHPMITVVNGQRVTFEEDQ